MVICGPLCNEYVKENSTKILAIYHEGYYQVWAISIGNHTYLSTIKNNCTSNSQVIV